ncbi:MAG: TIM-barrel domain-containing protein [Chloroflexota bacterium]
MSPFTKTQTSLTFRLNYELLQIESWGANSLRVRATTSPNLQADTISALLPVAASQATVEISDTVGRIANGNITAEVSAKGQIRFLKTGTTQEILAEKPIHLLSVPARSYLNAKNDLYHIEVNFAAYDDEHFFGLGQHQHGKLDQKGSVIDLLQRNTEITIPFTLSSRGYGFLWNNPAVGRVELGTTATRWVADATSQIDYWITVGDTPADILASYADVTGHTPRFPEWASGFWQSKLRYSTQQEVLDIAHEYHRRGLPLSVIVIDFFHWTLQGDWKFDPVCWPDPAAMVSELEALGVKVMVSIWPTVNRLSPNYALMAEQGLLVRTDRGVPAHMYFVDNQSEDGTYVHYYDSTHPQGRQFIWDRVAENYYDYGIKSFWLDVCEPEMLPMMPDNIRYYLGDGQAVTNIYPLAHTQGFYEGMRSRGEEEILFLCRSAWAGSQRYGAAVWSGDVQSTFEALQAQMRAGLNMAVSGIPWWTTDIGGFHGGNPQHPEFRELIVRWFQYAVFCPLFRLHGHRQPTTSQFVGADNEVWSFGEAAYEIIKDLLMLRERLRPYIMQHMQIAQDQGIPPMRPLFVDFYADANCTTIDDQFMFGSDLLIAPVVHQGERVRNVYLPALSHWTDVWTGQTLDGGKWISANAPLDRIPVYLRDNSGLLKVFEGFASNVAKNPL